ncbi:glycosyltransferase family 4 protein [bacterium]|nr:glycosyltransferase family 4 protein [bacterium]
MLHKMLYLSSSVNLWGARKSLLDILTHLDRKTFSPIVVCSSSGPLTEKLDEIKVPYRIVKMRLWRKGKYFPWIPSTVMRLAKLIKKERISLVHSNSHSDAPYGILACRFGKIPVVSHIRDIIQPDKVGKYLLKHADRLIAVSNAAARAFEDIKNKSEKLVVINNSVDLNNFKSSGDIRGELNISGDDIVIGIVGQISRLKGHDVFLKAASIILKKNKSVKFLIIGEVRRERDQGLCEPLISKLNLGKNVIFTGYRDDIANVMSSIDILAFPTLKESFGRSAIEAMALGKPVVASDVGGVPEIVIDGKSGILVSPGSPEELADGLLELINDKKKREDMGSEGLKVVREKFDIKHMMNRIEDVYKSFLS